jgi:very-short-patch-repair endonuclease
MDFDFFNTPGGPVLFRFSLMGYDRNNELVKKARSLRRNMTTAEVILWSRLRSKQIDGHKFRRQQPIFNYIVDFYCHDLKLIIEVDGEIHSLKEVIEYDKKRERILSINGYRLIRLSNFELISDTEAAITKIKTYITEILSPSQGDHRGLIS